MIKTCLHCKKEFELINTNENLVDDEPRYICDKCAVIHGVPEGWVKACESEKEVKK